MLERFRRSWSLIKASAALVRDNKALLLFPVFSGVAMVAVIATFVAPLVGGWELDRSPVASEAGQYLWAFGLYFALYFVGLFFNTALVSVALLHLSGSPGGLREGLARAAARLPVVLGYALLAATVGLLLRMIEERVGWVGRITAALIGVTWAVATFLVVPSLAARSIGPLAAVSESAALLKQTWGENIAGNVGISFVFTLGYALILFGMLGAVWTAVAASPELAVAILVVLVTLFVTLTVMHSALQGVYSAALYCYATLGEAAPGFSADALGGAFRRSKR